MTHSDDCTALVASFEGLRTTAYQDGGGIWTIGYGRTGDVHKGDTCTKEQALDWLNYDLATTDAAVNRLVKVPLNQHQHDALVSLCFNIGEGNFAKSTLLSLLNQGAEIGASQQFLRWDKVARVSSPGLAIRRAKEKVLFLEAE